MVDQQLADRYSRRTALKQLGKAGLGAVMLSGSSVAPVLGYDGAPHPIIGHWLAVTPLGPAHAVFSPRDEVLIAWPHSEDVERSSFSYTTSAAGSWQPVGPRGVYFTVVELHSKVGGEVIGTTSLEGILVVAEDGGSFRSGGSKEQVASWDSVAVNTMMVRDEVVFPTMSGIRMWPEEEPVQATPITILRHETSYR